MLEICIFQKVRFISQRIGVQIVHYAIYGGARPLSVSGSRYRMLNVITDASSIVTKKTIICLVYLSIGEILSDASEYRYSKKSEYRYSKKKRLTLLVIYDIIVYNHTHNMTYMTYFILKIAFFYSSAHNTGDVEVNKQ